VNEVLFVRHAQTDLAGTFCGHADPPINEEGRRQAEELAARLSTRRFHAIYSSDLRRAKDTAEILAGTLTAPVFTMRSLREIHFGQWEGLNWKQIEQRDGEYARRWVHAFPALPAPDGEPFAAFQDRVLDAADRLRCLAGGKRMIVVTHGGVLRVILCAILGCSEQDAWQRTRSYCCFFEADLARDAPEVMR
jgi:alpha-ribazole phosphatase